MAIERYIGGGKLYFSKYNGTSYDAEVEIGEIQSAKLKVTADYKDAFNRDGGVSKKVDKVAFSSEATLSFETQNVSKENVAMAMFGGLSTETFLTGDTLPDGTVATADTTLDVILGGQELLVEGKFKFIGTNLTGGRDPVLVVNHAVVSPSGDARDYFADKHSTLSFDGEMMLVDGSSEYFKEYLI